MPSTAPTTIPSNSEEMTSAATGPAVGGSSTLSTPPAAEPASADGPTGDPQRLVIPALGVDAPVDGILTGVGQVLRPPDDPARVGWWIASSPPGAGSGPTVLVGHVDSAADGPGALFAATDLAPGDQVVVRTSEGAEVHFEIVERSVYSKSDGLPPSLFALGGPPRLVLITCGGEFDPVAASYEQNIVLVAHPTGG